MRQTGKILGLEYQEQIYYAVFINVQAFDSPEETRVLAELGIEPFRASKLLLIAPLQEVSGGGEVVFTNMPSSLTPREPYIMAFQFVRDRWEEIKSGDVFNANQVLRSDGKLADYLVKTL